MNEYDITIYDNMAVVINPKPKTEEVYQKNTIEIKPYESNTENKQ